METVIQLVLGAIGSAIIHSVMGKLSAKFRFPLTAAIKQALPGAPAPVAPEVPAPPVLHVAAHTLTDDLPAIHN